MSWEIGGDALATYAGNGGNLSDYLTGADPYIDIVGDDDDDEDDWDDEDIVAALDMVGIDWGKLARQVVDPGGLIRKTAGAVSRRMPRRGRSRRRRRRSPVSQVAAAKAIAGGRVITQVAPTKAREWPLGFDSEQLAPGGIAAGASLDITSRPQVIFRPDRLVVSSSIAGDFLINDIKIGQKSQLINSQALPASMFSETAFGVRMVMDTAQISQDVVIRVTNISLAASRFNAGIIGPIIE